MCSSEWPRGSLQTVVFNTYFTGALQYKLVFLSTGLKFAKKVKMMSKTCTSEKNDKRLKVSRPVQLPWDNVGI